MAPLIMGAITFGLYLSLIIEVPARYLSKIKGVSYRFGTVISAIAMFSLFAYAFYQIFPILIDEGKKLFPLIQKAAEDLNLSTILPKETQIDQKVVDFIENITSEVVSRFSQFGVSILNTVIQHIPDAMTATVLFLVTAGYFTSLAPLLKRNLWRFFPKSSFPRSLDFFTSLYRDIRHFIAGQVMLAALIGTLVGFGMFVVNIPYPLFLGFLSGITNFVPFLGVFVAAIPAVLLGFTSAGISGVIKVIVILVIVNQLESWVLSPKIQGTRMKINWFAIIFSMFLCGAFFGIVGVLLAIPMMVFFRQYWTEYVQELFKAL
jgi:predicted PurR-regulated permease PerM